MSSGPAARARPSRLWAAKWSTMAGKMVKTSMRIGAAAAAVGSEARGAGPSGGVDGRAPAGRVVDDEVTGTRAPVSSSSRSDAGLSTTAAQRPDRLAADGRPPRRRPGRGPTARRGRRAARPAGAAPRSRSASSRSPQPAKVTIQRSWWGRADRDRRARRASVASTAPGARRSRRSVVSVTTTSPRRPWARPMRPTSSRVGRPTAAGTVSPRTRPRRRCRRGRRRPARRCGWPGRPGPACR